MSNYIKNSFLEYSDNFLKNSTTKNTNDNNIEEDMNFLNISKIVDLLSDRNSKFMNNEKEIEALILNRKSKFGKIEESKKNNLMKKKSSFKYEIINDILNSKIVKVNMKKNKKIKRLKKKNKSKKKKKKIISVKNGINNINIDFVEKINIYKYSKTLFGKKKKILDKSCKNKNSRKFFKKSKITNFTPKKNVTKKIKELRKKNKLKKKKISCDIDFIRFQKNKKIEKNIYQKFLKPTVSVKNICVNIIKNQNPTFTPKFEKKKKLKKNFSTNLLKYKKNLKTEKRDKKYFDKKFNTGDFKRNSSGNRFLLKKNNLNSESKKKFLNSLLKNLIE